MARLRGVLAQGCHPAREAAHREDEQAVRDRELLPRNVAARAEEVRGSRRLLQGGAAREPLGLRHALPACRRVQGHGRHRTSTGASSRSCWPSTRRCRKRTTTTARCCSRMATRRVPPTTSAWRPTRRRGATSPEKALEKLGPFSKRLKAARAAEKTDPKKALVEARVASALEPKNVEALLLVGSLYEETGEKKFAADAYQLGDGHRAEQRRSQGGTGASER